MSAFRDPIDAARGLVSSEPERATAYALIAIAEELREQNTIAVTAASVATTGLAGDYDEKNDIAKASLELLAYIAQAKQRRGDFA